MKRRIIALSLAAIIPLIGGCTDSASVEQTSHEKTEFTVSDNLLELSFFYMGSSVVLDSTLPVFKRAEELTNIRLNNILSKATSDAKQTFTMMMASRELPDMVNYHGREELFAYGMDGAFIPLNEHIEKSMPNFKKFLDTRDDVRKFITAPDGNIYFIPWVPDGDTSKGWFIRKDWLDKLNLPIPQSVDEYYEALTAFKTQDPNGNGNADEVPYFNRNMGTNFEEGISDLLNLWNAKRDFYADSDGNVRFGPIEPEFKEALKNIQKWYAEGLIDAEIYTRGSKARDFMLTNDLGGSTHDWFTSTSVFNSSMTERLPDFEFVPFRPPSGSEHARRTLLPQGSAITAANKNVEETVKFIDFWWTEQGRLLANFGIEGEHYTMVDGKPTFDADLLERIKNDSNILSKEYGIQTQMPFHQDFRYEEQMAHPIALQGMREYIENGYLETLFPALSFTPDEQKRYGELLTAINTLRDETVQRWVLNGTDIDSQYDEFISGMQKMNVEEFIALAQTAYDRYLSD